MTLLCKSCDKEKDPSQFSKHKDTVSGYDTSRCKSCKKSAWDWSKVSYEKRIFNRIKSRSKRKEIPFDLKISDIILPEVCPVFNKPFIYGDIDWTYSVDRFIPHLGYTSNNIEIISNKANRSKNNLNLKEIKQLLEYMEKKYNV